MIIKRTNKEMRQLRKKNNAIVDNYSEKVLAGIIYAVNHYAEQKSSSKFWDAELQKMLNRFYDCFTDIYANTSKELKNIFKDVENFQVKNIKDLTFKDDGKELDDRITGYWNQAEENLNAKDVDNQAIKVWLYNKLANILETDAKVVEEQVKKHKKPIITPGQYLIAEVGDCNCPQCGTYPADDYLPPPFHPKCPAMVSFAITDDPDDINDIDLEEEDME